MKSVLGTTFELFQTKLGASAVDTIPNGAFRTAMRQVAASVVVATAQWQNIRSGLTATAVCAAAALPPTMLVSVNKAAAADRLISDSGAFAINYLAEGQHRIARLFANTRLSDKARFLDGDWCTLETGSPVLEGSAASLDCRVQSRIAMPTHHIYLGRVVAVTVFDDRPLLYRDGNFRRLQPVR